jgi:hypothetical protein
MSSSLLVSAWSERLARLEKLLKRPDLVSQISKHQGMPYALFPYPPTAEREVRKEVRLLATRVRQQSGREVVILSMAELLWRVLDQLPPGRSLFDLERKMASWEPRRRLEKVQETILNALTGRGTLHRLIAEPLAGKDPERAVAFLTRVGALYPVYRASTLLDNLESDVRVPVILFYPGTRSGTNSLRFMDSLDALHSYRHKIY